MKNLKLADIEHIHDVLVGIFMPFDEYVSSTEKRDEGMIESALGRPFQTAFGQELWPTIQQKAAVLFHSLVCNHCFINGNKRTAVIALDLFLGVNDHLLLLASKDVYNLAIETATANEQGRPLDELLAFLAARVEEFSIHREDQYLEARIKAFGPLTLIQSLMHRLAHAERRFGGSATR